MREASHFDHLLRLLALEGAAQHERFAAMRRELSPEERAGRGLALLDLEAVDEEWGLAGRLLVTLERGEKGALDVPIGSGDLVEIAPRRVKIDEPARGVVARRSRTRLVVAFDRPPPPFVLEGRLLVDLVPNDVTLARARSAIAGVRGSRRWADVLLGASPARVDSPVRFEPSRPLNPEQVEAVSRALAARDLFLVHGPPGTGKSTVLAEVASQSAAAGRRILATAASNAAVDHLLDLCLGRGLSALRIGHPARVTPRLVEHTLDAQVEAHPDRKVARELLDEAHELLGYARRQRSRGRSRERHQNARDAKAEARRLLDEARRKERLIVRSIFDRAQVVCGTLASLFVSELEDEAFDVALFDEATQAVEPIALAAFLKAGRVVLAGDHRQLPPTVLSMEAQSSGLGTSLFERLLEDHGDGIRLMLREQYRMSEGIMAFPSGETYGGELRAHPSVASRTLDEVLERPGLDAPPVLFLDTAGRGFEDEVAEGTDSRANPGEAALVTARLVALLDAGLPAAEVAVIAPYSAQVALLRTMAAARGVPESVEIDTVDAFQGREKDAILLSLVRSNAEGAIGFLADLRRMNVAITRARRHLFVVGDSATLGAEPYYQRFLASVEAAGGYRSSWDPEWATP